MEILNQVILAGNLTDQPSVSDAGGRQFIRARLAQSWFYETQGKTVEHRQFIPLTFFGESTIAAKSFQKGDNIHVTGQLIRRDARPRPEEANTGREPGTIYEIHVIRAFRIATSLKAGENTTHQNEIRRMNDAKRVPSFLEESIRDWPV
jgi:Single-strand binding protein family